MNQRAADRCPGSGYGILSALRVPERCLGSAPAPAVPVNTFRTVFGCVMGKTVPLLEPERFSMVYGEAAVEPMDRPVGRRP